MTRQKLMLQQHLVRVPEIRQDMNSLANGTIVVRLEIIEDLVLSASDPAVFDAIASAASLAAEALRASYRKRGARV